VAIGLFLWRVDVCVCQVVEVLQVHEQQEHVDVVRAHWLLEVFRIKSLELRVGSWEEVEVVLCHRHGDEILAGDSRKWLVVARRPIFKDEFLRVVFFLAVSHQLRDSINGASRVEGASRRAARGPWNSERADRAGVGAGKAQVAEEGGKVPRTVQATGGVVHGGSERQRFWGMRRRADSSGGRESRRRRERGKLTGALKMAGMLAPATTTRIPAGGDKVVSGEAVMAALDRFFEWRWNGELSGRS
jgi:hypothetical protein